MLLLLAIALVAALLYRRYTQSEARDRQLEYDKLVYWTLETEIKLLENLLASAMLGGRPEKQQTLIRSLRDVLKTTDLACGNTKSQDVIDLGDEIEELVFRIAKTCEVWGGVYV
jgi:hypothetical protein